MTQDTGNKRKEKHSSPHRTTSVRTLSLLMLIVAFLASAFEASAEPRKQSNKGKTSVQQEFTLVIDAGHGGHDHGAMDNGASEKDINLAVAKKFAALVKKKLKNVKVVMTRDDDTFISLQERANIANRNKGNLFVSIHTNSVDKNNPNRKSVAGANVYALGPQKDANNLKVAQRENSVIELEDNYHQKYSGFDPSKDESYIIFEMAQKKNLGQSLKFADKAQKELVSTAGRGDRGVKQAGFWVLWATAMPSVLVELDFICNPNEAQFLTSEAGQQKLAEALANAVEQYVKGGGKATAMKVSDSAKTPVPAESIAENTAVSPDPSGVNTLAASNSGSRREKQHLDKSKDPRYSGNSTARRRRSETSKKKSESRSVETESILLTSESDYLAQQESLAPAKEEPVVEENRKMTKKEKKAEKKRKEQEKKRLEAEKKKKLEQEKKAKQMAKAGKKTFSVKNSGASQSALPAAKTSAAATATTAAATAAAAATPAAKNAQLPARSSEKKDSKGKLQARNKTAESSGAAQASQGQELLYTIVLLTSQKELKSDDPAFEGIVPTGMFKENGKYKYTYGSSKDRHEIEQRLLQIKSIIPEAQIVVRMK